MSKKKIRIEWEKFIDDYSDFFMTKEEYWKIKIDKIVRDAKKQIK